MGLVYLLHFNKPYRHARHYIGYVSKKSKLSERLARHRSGNGARLIEVITQAGLTFECVRTWNNVDRAHERKLKKRKSASRFCPVCQRDASITKEKT